MNKQKIRHYIRLLRPFTLPASLCPVILGLTLCAKIQDIQYFYAFLTLLSALMMQGLANGANDFFDGIKGVDGTDRIGPLRVTQNGLLDIQEIKIFLVMMSLSLLGIGYVISLRAGAGSYALGLACLGVAYLYSTGPFPLSKYCLGELFAFIFFGPVPVLGTCYIQLGRVPWEYMYLSFIPGFFSAALMATNNLRDRVSDRRVKKYTLANVFPEFMARLLPVIFFLAPSGIALYYFFFRGGSSFLLFSVLLFTPFLSMIKSYLDSPIDGSLNTNLKIVGKYMVIFTLFFSYGIYKSDILP